MKRDELWYEYHTKKTKEERDCFLASLSSEDFSDMMSLPIGNVARINLSRFRKEKKTMNLNKYVIHIPHSSLFIPESFQKRLLVDQDYFDKENLLMCDYQIDQFVPDDFSNIVKFEYSRMYCDVERYLNSDEEEMSKYGMGVLYTMDSNGMEFVNRDSKDDKKIIQDLYEKHHAKLDCLVGEILREYGICYIIDLHSFSDEFVQKIFHKKNTPDICIGVNTNFDLELLEKTISHFRKFGYSVNINYPYTGSVVSKKYADVQSMMLEINKRIYLGNQKEHDKFCHCMKKYYDLLSRK